MPLSAYAAQCMICKHARWRGNDVRACLRFEQLEGGPLPTELAIVVQALLFQNAAERACPARERLVVGPDAYLAQDLPDDAQTA